VPSFAGVTVAIVESEHIQVTVLSVAPLGFTVAVSVSVFPTVMPERVLSKLTL
jgi:hypothetical protein